jgi:hypothetical protein
MNLPTEIILEMSRCLAVEVETRIVSTTWRAVRGILLIHVLVLLGHIELAESSRPAGRGVALAVRQRLLLCKEPQWHAVKA